MWGWNFDFPATFDLLPGVSFCRSMCDQQTARAGLARFVEQDIDPRLYRLRRAIGTPCYSVSPAGAERLRRHCLPLRPMPIHFPVIRHTMANVGIDIMMTHLYPAIEAYLSFPPLVVTPNDARVSTIQTGVSLADLQERRRAKS